MSHRNLFVCLLMPGLLGSPVLAQADRNPVGSKPLAVPAISGRSFTAGSATVTVTGTFQVQAEIPLHDQASFGDGEMTWLQFNDGVSNQPNAPITYGQEVGVSVESGSHTVTAGDEHCTGEATVTASSITGHYICTGVTSYDKATRRMGKVNLDIRFGAKS